jgi:hypothetical protein
METLHPRIRTHDNCLFQPQELDYFRTAQKLNDQQARWSLYLSGFNLKLIHLPRTKMVQSDALSRRPDYETDKRMEEEDKVVLPDNLC